MHSAQCRSAHPVHKPTLHQAELCSHIRICTTHASACVRMLCYLLARVYTDLCEWMGLRRPQKHERAMVSPYSQSVREMVARALHAHHSLHHSLWRITHLICDGVCHVCGKYVHTQRENVHSVHSERWFVLRNKTDESQLLSSAGLFYEECFVLLLKLKCILFMDLMR